MIKLNFTEKDLETLRDYLQSELLKAEQKIDNIRGVLVKIGSKLGKSVKTSEKAGKKKKVHAKKVIKATTLERKKPGRKPKAPLTAAPEKKVAAKRGRPPIKKEGLSVVVKKKNLVKKVAKAKPVTNKIVKKAKPAAAAKKAVKKTVPKIAVKNTVKKTVKRRPAVKKVLPETIIPPVTPNQEAKD